MQNNYLAKAFFVPHFIYPPDKSGGNSRGISKYKSGGNSRGISKYKSGGNSRGNSRGNSAMNSGIKIDFPIFIKIAKGNFNKNGDGGMKT